MRAMAVLRACIAGVVGLSGASLAESYRFDMGSADSPVAEGHTRVTTAERFGDASPFGWTAAPMTTIYRNDPTNPYFAEGEASTEYCLYSDGVLSIEENSFVFRVQPGRYAVTAVIGDLALGEWRPGNSIWANGALVAQEQSTGGTVKAFALPVEAADGLVALRFRADSEQKYVTVIAVTAEPLAEGQDPAPSAKEYPEQKTTREGYLRNWDRLQKLFAADWEQAKQELAAEGVDLAYWQSASAKAKGQPGYREYWGWGLGSGSWERLWQQVGEVDLSSILDATREMGVDGFITNSGPIARQLQARGFRHAWSGHAERYPTGDLSGVTLNLMRNPDGSETTVPAVWSNCAPEAISAFQDLWRRMLADAAPGAAFFMIDEPRGMWYSGPYGDHSAPAQEAFRKWANGRGYSDLAATGIPPRGRTLDFYRFYQFRMDSVALFAKATIADTPAAAVPTVPGNGDIGPEQVNHSSNWPPAMARNGLIAASWSYGEPASVKMHAETVRTAHEHGGESIIVPPLYTEAHTALQDIPMNAAGISALNTRVAPWHFGGPVNGPNRTEWMKAVYYGARLAHATSGLTHTPPVYVWCPDSIAYNDLVETDRAETEAWKALARRLFDANLDYAVTNTLAVPPGVPVLFACARPVLSDEEFDALQRFMAAGGTLLCTFAGAAEYPDGRSIEGWQALPQERVQRLDLAAPDLRDRIARCGAVLNLATETPAAKSYLYLRDGVRVHLLNNTDLERQARVSPPAPSTDLLTGKLLPDGEEVTIAPGLHALLAERTRP